MDDLRLLTCPPDLRTRAIEIVDGTVTDPPPAELSAVLPDGLVPGRGWPQHGDLVGIAFYAGNRLVVLGDEVIGGCGPKGEVTGGRAEIGYGFAAAYQGRGIGTAAVRLLIAELLLDPEVREISADMLEGNVASWRLVERLGFQRVACDLDGHRRYVLAAPNGATVSPG